MAVASLGGLGWCVARIKQAGLGMEPVRFAAVTGLIFAGQTMNVPLAFGSSGHLFGGVLAAVLLGVPWGILSIALVLLVQCVVFSDGGLVALGANVFNMGLIGAGLGGWLAERWRTRGWRLPWAAGLAGFVSVLVAAAAACAQLAWSGVTSLGAACGSLLLPHVAVAALEGLISAGVVWAVVRDGEEIPAGGKAMPIWIFGLPALAVVLGLFSPMASPLPDAYERGLAVIGVEPREGPVFSGLLAEYALAGLGEAVAVIAAVWLGTVLVWVLAGVAAVGMQWARFREGGERLPQ